MLIFIGEHANWCILIDCINEAVASQIRNVFFINGKELNIQVRRKKGEIQ